MQEDLHMLLTAWHSVEGYSKVGTYTGNGNAAGTFVYTGFQPRMGVSKSHHRSYRSKDGLWQDNKSGILEKMCDKDRLVADANACRILTDANARL